MAKKTPGDEAPIAPATPVQTAPVYQPPRRKYIERQGGSAEPSSVRYPDVRGGVCSYCGVLDPNVPSQYQYRLCPHFRGLELKCSYCPDNKDPEQVVGHTVLHVQEHPSNPDALVVWCDSLTCSQAHLDRFKVSKR